MRFEDVDWTDRAEYILDKHGMTVAAANSALHDPGRVVIEPDYASKSGLSVRIIGYSEAIDDVLTVIVMEATHPLYHLAWEYGVNCWPASPRDRRIYRDTEGV